jgi:nitrogen regulatory protein PII
MESSGTSKVQKAGKWWEERENWRWKKAGLTTMWVRETSGRGRKIEVTFRAQLIDEKTIHAASCEVRMKDWNVRVVLNFLYSLEKRGSLNGARLRGKI